MHTIVIASLIMAITCLIVIVVDIFAGNRQHMMVMNFVYPITALYAGPLALLVYYTIGRKSTTKAVMQAKEKNEKPPNKKKPFWQSVAVGALHCGGGCTIGDIIAESALLAFPLVLFGKKLYGAWAVDYILALGIGILFQYYAIKPMKDLSPKEGIKAAIKADTLSLTFWQIGMYGWMAIATFLIFGHELKASEPMFWFMMQIAMLCGFLTAYPINWWLIKKKIKEEM
ncbi:MAG: DUF4396 domain-containing protein [Ginsengibacter sp.]